MNEGGGKLKSGKISLALLFIGILLLLAGIALGKSVAQKGLEINGAYSMEKVVVSVKNQLDIYNTSSFTLNDIKELVKELQTNELTYTCSPALTSSRISGNNSNCKVKITGTNYLYPMFHQLPFEYGGFFTYKNEEEGGYVAIIEETAAWNLFKTKNAVGKTIEIYDVPFKVVGVYAKDDSIIGTLTDSRIPDVFIPVRRMLELDATAKIKSFQVKTSDTSTLDLNTAHVSTALQQIGKSPSNYSIEDYNLKEALIKQKPMIIVFVMGFIMICIFLFQIKNILKDISVLIAYKCRTDYLSHVIRKNVVFLGISLIKVMVSIGCIILIWTGIRTNLYIPAKYIADELINVTYYVNLFKSSVQSSISSLGYIAPHTELLMNTLWKISNWTFSIPLILGFLLIYLGIWQLKTSDIIMSRLIAYIGLSVITSLFIIVVSSYLLGLPLVMDTKSLLVAWSFMTVTAVRISISINLNKNGKESDLLNV
jgi:hypothetical protein